MHFSLPRTLLVAFSAAGVLSAASCRSDRGRPSADETLPHASSRLAAASLARESLATGVRENQPLPLAKKLCEALHLLPAQRKAQCCGTPPQRFLLDECVQAVTRSLDSRSVDLDPRAVQACVTSVEETLTGCDWVTPGQPLTPAACQAVFRGKVLAGSACRSSLECEGDLHCNGTTPTRAGVCATPAGVGAGCGTHVDALAAYTLTRGLERSHPFCADFCSLLSHKCEASPPEGARCMASVNCARGQTCVRGACSAARRRQRGQTCDGADCEEGLRCVEGECRELARAGQACKTDFDCATGGCLAAPNGAATCGAKCSVSLAMLKSGSGPGMRLASPTSLAPRASD